MRKFGLIGFPLSHSFSKKYFEAKFQREGIADGAYENFELESIAEFPSLLRSNPDLAGLNVTIHCKESVIPFLDSITDEAKAIGAVNCIRIKNGKTEGWNTDAIAFEKSLLNFFDKSEAPFRGLGVFVLGTGGSSKAIQFVLKNLGITFQKVSREKKSDCILHGEISVLMKGRNLFINCTPLGMFPEVNAAPEIPYEKLSASDFLFDLVYNPSETLFLKKGKERGAKTKNGLEMLELQAEESWKIWNA